MAATTKKTTSSKTTGAAKKRTEKEKASGSRSATGTKAKPASKSSGGESKGGVSKAGASTASGISKTPSKKTSADSKKARSQASAAGKLKAATSGSVRSGASPKSKSAGTNSTSKEKVGSKKSAGTSMPARTTKSSRPAKKGIVGRLTEAVDSLLTGGERDVLDLLKEDHRKVDGYFQKVKAAEDADHEAVFKKIKAELDLHAHVEELIFYPHLMKVGNEELKKIVREGVEEHRQVKTLLTELSKLKGTDKVFKAKLKVLIENVEHHVEEEENEMFSLVEDQLDEDVRVELANRVEKERQSVGGAKPKSRGTKSVKNTRR